jgi:hypothetical protein
MGKQTLQWVGMVVTLFLSYQVACSWFGPDTVACHMWGACLPEVLCPCSHSGIAAFHGLYRGYARAFFVSTQTTPALTCIKTRLMAANTPETYQPLTQVEQLESTGLMISTNTKNMMHDIEHKTLWPLEKLAEHITHEVPRIHTLVQTCNATNCSVVIKKETDVFSMYIARECMKVSSEITVQITAANDLGLEMDTFASNVKTFGDTLKQEWIPLMQSHKDAKVATSFKVVGVAGLVAAGGAIIASAPITIPTLAAYGASTAILGACGTYTIGYYESKWKHAGELVRTAGSDIQTYSTIMQNAIAPITEAAQGLHAITQNLADLKKATGSAISAADPKHTTQTLLDNVVEASRDIREKAWPVRMSIDNERRILVSQREYAISNDDSNCI